MTSTRSSTSAGRWPRRRSGGRSRWSWTRRLRRCAGGCHPRPPRCARSAAGCCCGRGPSGWTAWPRCWPGSAGRSRCGPRRSCAASCGRSRPRSRGGPPRRLANPRPPLERRRDMSANREQRATRVRGALAGIVAAGAALGAGELVAGAIGSIASPVVAVGGCIVDAAPEWLKAFAIRALGSADKAVLIGGILVVLVVVAALLGGLALRRLRPASVVVAALGVLGAVIAVRRPAAAPLDMLPSLAAAAAGIAALALLARSAS